MPKSRKLQIRKLLFGQIFFVLMTFTLMVVISRSFVNEMLRNNLRSESKEIFNRVSLEIEAEFFEPQTALITVSETIRNMIINGNSLIEIYETMEKLSDELSYKPEGFTFISIFSYFEVFGGIYMIAPGWESPQDYDPTTRQWYKTAVEANGKPAYTPVYMNMRTNDYTVSFVRRIFDDDGNPLAIISISMPLDRIRNYIASMRITEGSYGILHNENMEVLYHPDLELIGKSTGEIGGSLSELADDIIDGMELYEYETHNYKGELCVVYSTSLKNGWILYLVTPKAQYYMVLRNVDLALIGFGVLCASVLCAFLIYFDRIRRKTEEKQRLKEIRLNEIQKTQEEDERTRLMLDASPLGASFRDKKYNTLYCSQTTVKMFGLKDKQEFIDRFDELSPEYQPCGRISKEMIHELHDKVLEEGYVCCEWMHQNLKREQIPCEITGVRVEYRGEPCVLAYMRDLRDIKTAMAEKEETEERMNLIINSMPLVCNLWTQDYQNILTNDEALKLFGLSSKEEYITNFYDLSPEYQPSGRPSRVMVREHLARAFYSGYEQFEWMHQKLDGEPLPAEITLVRIKYKGGYAVIGYSRDLRQHKQIMSAIKRRDVLLNMVNKEAIILLGEKNEDNMNDSIFKCMELLGNTVDVDHVQIWQNKMINGIMHTVHLFQWESELGRLNRSVPIGHSFPLTVLPGYTNKFSLDPNLNGPVSELPAEDQKFFTPYKIKSFLTVPLFFNDHFWGNLTLDDCRNERTFSLGDIEILRSSGLLIANAFIRNDMIQNIRSSAKKLEEALEQTREANNAKSKFLATISHEIRTPMNVIMGSAESLLENDALSNDVPLTRELKEALEKIYGSGDLLLQIINDILDLSKIEANKFEITCKNYEITTLVSDAANLNLLKYGFKDIKFNLSVSENLPLVLIGDELRVKQIINNLVSNAFKYTDSGTVTIIFDCENTTKTKTTLVIHVTDTGLGMTQEQLNLIYDEYTRFNFEANRTTTGTGLGMAITRNLVRLMEGDIKVKSEVGKGSSFTVRIPQGVADSGILGKEAAEKLNSFHFGSLRKKKEKIIKEPMPYGKVLIVDDMKSNIDVAVLLLKPYQLQIDTAESGYEAIEKIKAGNTYDIIFMDHMMPKMDGIETVKNIRETGYTGTIVALTANAIVGQAQMFKENGFDGCITKPIDTRELNAVLIEYIKKRKKREK